MRESCSRKLGFGYFAIACCCLAAVALIGCRETTSPPTSYLPPLHSQPFPVTAAAPSQPSAQEAIARLGQPGPRQVFNYAVVPSGTYTRDDVRYAVLTSPEVGAHYAPVQIEALRPAVQPVTERAYVSYKKHGKVYWTSYQVTLHEGEMVLTDGVHRIRARCGNRISVVPGEPVLPVAEEPPPEELRQVETEFQPVQGLPPVSSFAWALPMFLPPAFWYPDYGHSHDSEPPVDTVPEMPGLSYLGMGLTAVLAWGARFRRSRKKA